MINLDFYKTGDGTNQFWGDVLCNLSSADGNSVAGKSQGTCRVQHYYMGVTQSVHGVS